ncbi:hypothetical protein ACR3K2_24290 [Cryptosporidium serpentis]
MEWKISAEIYNIDALIQRVCEIEAYCNPLKQKDDFKGNIQDEYLKHKICFMNLYNDINKYMENYKSYEIQHDRIIKRIQIDDMIRRLQDELDTLYKINRTPSLKLIGSKYSFKQKRAEEIQNLRDELLIDIINRYNRLFQDSKVETRKVQTLKSIQSRHNTEAFFNKKSNSYVKELSNTDKETLNCWHIKSKELDKEIEDIGNIALRISERAEKLTSESAKQKHVIEDIVSHVKFTSSEATSVNASIRKLIRTSSNVTFCCRISLAVATMVVVAVIIVLSIKKLV